MIPVFLVLIFLRSNRADEGINFAAGKPTWQSSTEQNGISSNAVDGYRNPYYTENSCVQTTRQYEPWWIVDLQEDIFVTSVRITNRKDCCWENLANFNIRVGSDSSGGGTQNPICAPTYKRNVGAGQTESITCMPPRLGKYVTITINDAGGTLNFCEFEVYGYRRTNAFSVKAISYGKKDIAEGKKSTLTVDDFHTRFYYRGHYIFTFNMTTGASVRSLQRFDTVYDPSSATNMPLYLQALPSEVFIVVLMNEAGHKYYHSSVPILKTLSGSSSISRQLTWSDSWSLLGYKGQLPSPSWRNSVMKTVGYGPAVIDAVVPKLLVPPNPPSDATIVDLTESSITVSWSRPLGIFTQNIMPLNYTVCLGETGNTTSTCRNVENEHIYTATGMQSQTNYTISAMASSYAGFGPSVSIKLTTMEKDSFMIYVELVSRIEEDVLYRSDGTPYSSITIKGQQKQFATHGHHFVVLDAKTGVQTSQMSFDTHNDAESGNKMAQFLSGIPDKRIILMVVYYQGHDYYNNSATTLSSICPHAPSSYSSRQSWSMICLKGFGAMPWMKSNISSALEGAATVKSHILLPKELQVAPVINNIVASGPRSLEIQWSPPATDSYTGDLVAFQICYQESHITGDNCSMVNVDGGLVQALVNNLHPFQGYDVKMRGVVAMGYGPFSNTMSLTTLEAEPSAGPSNVTFPSVDSSSILLAWSSPDVQHRNGIILQYSVCYQEEAQRITPCNKTSVLPANQTSYTTNGLKPYTRYKFELKAATVVGFGPATVAYYRTYLAPPDGPPLEPRASHVTSTSVTLAWLPPRPEQRNGIIHNYKICIRTSPGPCEMTAWSGNQTGYTVTSLKPYTMYNFSISAATVAGVGPSVVLLNRTLQTEPSGPPTSLSLVNVNQTHIIVTWSPPVTSQLNGILTGYSVCVKPESDIVCQHQDTVPVSQTSYVFSGLAPYINYTILVSAGTVVGFGPNVIFTQRTSSSAPAGPPTMVTVTFLNGTMIVFTWSPPEQNARNGEIIMYTLCLREYGSLVACSKSTNVTGSQNYQRFTDLNPSKEYIISIKAGTTNGLGPPAFVQKTAGQCDLPVLLRDGVVPDQGFSASGYLGDHYEPYQARVNNELPWCERGSRKDAYLQVDFGGELRILGVSTQGHRRHWRSWVTSYNLLYSIDGLVWRYVTVGGDKVIKGNTEDGEKVVNHFLDEPVVTRYVRFKILSFIGLHQCMRVEIIGCAPASRPETASLEFINSTSIRVSWNPSKETANGRINGYKICCKESSSRLPCENSALVHHMTTSHMISQLIAYTSYTIEISAGTIAGYGPPFILQARTNESAPTGPPFVIMAQDVTATSLTLVWSPPDERHRSGLITKYGVCYQKSELRTNCRDIKEVDEDEKLHELNDLLPNTKYLLQVRAATIFGWGPPGAVYATTLTSAPSGPPTSVRVTDLGATVLQISWFPPALEKRNGLIVGYRVCFMEESETEQCRNYVSLPETQTTYSVAGLKANTVYNIHVEAKTSIGYGPPFVVTRKTGESAPSGPPRNVVVTSFNSTSIKLTWDPPEKDTRNGLITSYEVVAFREIAGSKIERLSSLLVPSTVTSWSSVKLSPNTDHIFHVKAGTAKGFGPSVIVHKKTEGIDASDSGFSSEGKLTSGGIAGGSVLLIVIITGFILSVLWNKGLLPNTRAKRLKDKAQKRRRRKTGRRRKRRRRRKKRRRRKEISEIQVVVHETDSVYSELNDYDAPARPKRKKKGSIKVLTSEDLYGTLGTPSPDQDIYATTETIYGAGPSGLGHELYGTRSLGPHGHEVYDPAENAAQNNVPSSYPSVIPQSNIHQPTISGPVVVPPMIHHEPSMSEPSVPQFTLSQTSCIPAPIKSQTVMITSRERKSSQNFSQNLSAPRKSAIPLPNISQQTIPSTSLSSPPGTKSSQRLHEPTSLQTNFPTPSISRLTTH